MMLNMTSRGTTIGAATISDPPFGGTYSRMACASSFALLNSSTSQAELLPETKLTTPPDTTLAFVGLKLMLVALFMVTVRSGASCWGFIEALDMSLSSCCFYLLSVDAETWIVQYRLQAGAAAQAVQSLAR